ncbi:dGTP triphosphohydrolase [Cetobacterium sp. 2G large]|uniref:dGTP triphosphohydrolase n=1 Tax=Cetobacterium sp. 2G large TaxID=2759680 RepID=UPI00163C1A4A|nr:dNTP triphosphohydrolase [Cetobacterium sp. 2G large]MBC2853516.1 dNTP triphosphohydrolase [Cetobacterium sp. 2G large]
MKWNKLLCEKRFKQSSNEAYEFDERNEFDKDYSRIISSSSFRRLQDKTQVYPLKRGDFVRTRLTHSLEVSHIASSIGKSIEKYLQRGDQKISSLLSVTGLIHDLGNPPFGHSGEYIIQDFFKEYLKKSGYDNILTNIQKEDLLCFDGNVQTFRILRKLQYLGDKDSYNLTYATLATIMKYPTNSVEGNKKDKGKLIERKFGYFDSEKSDYDKIFEEMGIKGKRHPITFLLEAADDIAYCVADIEDGVQKKFITLQDLKNMLKKIGRKSLEVQELLEKIKEYEEKNKEIENSSLFEKIVVQKIKIYIQGKMIQEVIKSFIKNEEFILNGDFNKELLDDGAYKEIKDGLKNLAKNKIFQSKERVFTDILAAKVLRKLLNIFIEGMIDWLNNEEEASLTSRNIRVLISENYIINYESELKECKNKGDEIYTTLKLCVDFISGMTDQFAVDLYKKLQGISE